MRRERRRRMSAESTDQQRDVLQVEDGMAIRKCRQSGGCVQGREPSPEEGAAVDARLATLLFRYMAGRCAYLRLACPPVATSGFTGPKLTSGFCSPPDQKYRPISPETVNYTSKSASVLPAFRASTTHCGLTPLPAHVSDLSAGLQYFGLSFLPASLLTRF